MERALGVPEIVSQVLQNVNKSNQTSAARTCRFWSCIALDWIWKDMKSFYPLLELLSPLVIRGNEWHFPPDLSNANWDRFDSYASRIRKLEHNDDRKFQGFPAIPSLHLFSRITERRSPRLITPNVFDIIWTSRDATTLPLVLYFVSPTVTALEINCDGDAVSACPALLDGLNQLDLSLHRFIFAADGSNRDYVPNLTTFISGQKRLITAFLPPFSATSLLVNVLGELPLLQEYANWSTVEYQWPDESGMCFRWVPGTFKTLQKLGFDAWPSLTDGSVLLESPHTTNLHTLLLTCRSVFHADALHSLTTTLATVHHNLTDITLSLFAVDDNNPSPESIGFNCIRPLLQCRALSFLHLWHNQAVTYTKEEIVAMAAAWPMMEVLELFADPTLDTGWEHGQPLQSVGVFLEKFSALTHLAVFINVVSAAIPKESHVAIIDLCKLKILDFGTSPGMFEDNPDVQRDVALYISTIVTRDVKIRGHRSAGHIRGVATTEEDDEEYDARFSFWFDIGTRVELVFAARQHMTEDMHALTLRNHALLERVRELEQSQGALITS
ncbi:hypothetical protein FRB95_013104 [Tulasnella sp. JGI-2019a]|nr:hypothetical protein FRB95_013104 [Tulasnella sp. JGI-2019a]